MERVPEGLQGFCSVAFRDFLHRVLREQFPCFVEFFLVPATVIDLRLYAVLNHEAPAFLLRTAGLTLEPANEVGPSLFPESTSA